MLVKGIVLFLFYTTILIPISQIGVSKKPREFNFYMIDESDSHSMGYSRVNERAAPMGIIKGQNIIYGAGSLTRPYCFWLWDSCFNTKRRYDYNEQTPYAAHIRLHTQPVVIQTSAKENGSALFLFLRKQHVFEYGFATTTSESYGIFQYRKRGRRLFIAGNDKAYEFYAESFFRKTKLTVDLRKRNVSVFKKFSLKATNYEFSGLYLRDASRALWAKYSINDWNVLIFSENMQEANLQFGRSTQQGPLEYNLQIGFAPDTILAGIGARHYRISYDCFYFYTTSSRQTNLLFLLRDDSSKVSFLDWSYLAENCYHRINYQSPELNLSLYFGEALNYFMLEFRYQAV